MYILLELREGDRQVMTVDIDQLEDLVERSIAEFGDDYYSPDLITGLRMCVHMAKDLKPKTAENSSVYPTIAELQKEVKYWHELSNSYEQTIVRLTEAASAQPERKKGKWTNENGADGWNRCSVCGELAIDLFDYCPCCGADMREGEKDG